MPNITQYTNPDTSINLEGFQQAARRIGAFATQEAGSVEQTGRELGQGIEKGANEVARTTEQHIDYWDKTRVASQSTAVAADIEQQWQAKLKGTPDPNRPGKFVPGLEPADPTDPNVAKRFQQDVVEPMLDDLKKTPLGLNGADYAENKVAELRQHFDTSFKADMATQAGKAIVLSDVRTTNNLSALVSSVPSFHNVDFALKQLDDLSVSHQGVPTVTADMLAELKLHNQSNKEAVVHAAAAAAIQKDGVDPVKVAQSFIDKYPDYIKPAETIQLAKAAQQQVKFNASLDRSAKIQDKEIKRQQADADANKLQASLVNEDGSHNVAGPAYFKQWRTLANNGDANPEQLRALYTFGEKHDGTDRTYTEPEVGKTLADGILDGTVTDTDLVKASNAGKLSDKDFTRYTQNLKLIGQLGEQTEGFQSAMKAVDELLVDRTAGPDPLGVALSSKVKSQFLPAFVSALQKKELPPNALDMTDPKSMIRQFIDPQLPSLKDHTQVQAFLAATGPQADGDGAGLLQKAKAWFTLQPSYAIPVKDPADIERLKLPPGTAIRIPGGGIRYVPAPKENP